MTTPTTKDDGSPDKPHPQQKEELGTDSRERLDTLNSLFEEEEEEKREGEGCYGEDLVPSPGPWCFMYLRVSQSAQQSPANPIIGIEIPVPRNQRESSPSIQAVRTWFIFAIPTPRYEMYCKVVINMLLIWEM